VAALTTLIYIATIKNQSYLLFWISKFIFIVLFLFPYFNFYVDCIHTWVSSTRRSGHSGMLAHRRTPSEKLAAAEALRQQQDRTSDESVKAKMVQAEESLHTDRRKQKREQPLAEKSPMQGTSMSRTTPSR
jgi:hypothetical protein